MYCRSVKSTLVLFEVQVCLLVCLGHEQVICKVQAVLGIRYSQFQSTYVLSNLCWLELFEVQVCLLVGGGHE